MKIVLVARRYWPAVGGVETYLRHVAQALAVEHDVTVLASRVDERPNTRLGDSLRMPPPFIPFVDGGVRVEPLHLSPARRALLAPLLAQVTPGLRRYAYGRARVGMAALYSTVVAPVIARSAESADVVHVWGSDLLAAATVRASKLLGVPVVITPFAHKGQWGDDPASARAYRHADRVVALLEAEADTYRALGVPGSRIAVYGVGKPGVAAGGGSGLRARYGIDGPLVLFLGVRRAYKGYDVLLRAAEDVAAQLPRVTFAFVGPGDTLPPSDTARVIDVGPVAEDERAAWLDASDLLCLPSEGEILPVSILEGWSVATPALASDIPTLRELIETSGGGAVSSRDPVVLAEAIVRLLDEPDKLRELGRHGQSFWAANYTVEAVTKRHITLYEALCPPPLRARRIEAAAGA